VLFKDNITEREALVVCCRTGTFKDNITERDLAQSSAAGKEHSKIVLLDEIWPGRLLQDRNIQR
jgi:hypothetical protein